MYKVPTITMYTVQHETCELPGRTVPADVDELFGRYFSIPDHNNREIARFDDIESARKVLAEYRCSAWKSGSIVSAELYWIESGTYDATDGELLDGSDIWDYEFYDRRINNV